MFLPRTPSTAATSASLTKPLPVGVARAVFFRDHDGRVGGDPLIKLGDRKRVDCDMPFKFFYYLFEMIRIKERGWRKLAG